MNSETQQYIACDLVMAKYFEEYKKTIASEDPLKIPKIIDIYNVIYHIIFNTLPFFILTDAVGGKYILECQQKFCDIIQQYYPGLYPFGCLVNIMVKNKLGNHLKVLIDYISDERNFTNIKSIIYTDKQYKVKNVYSNSIREILILDITTYVMFYPDKNLVPIIIYLMHLLSNEYSPAKRVAKDRAYKFLKLMIKTDDDLDLVDYFNDLYDVNYDDLVEHANDLFQRIIRMDNLYLLEWLIYDFMIFLTGEKIDVVNSRVMKVMIRNRKICNTIRLEFKEIGNELINNYNSYLYRVTNKKCLEWLIKTFELDSNPLFNARQIMNIAVKISGPKTINLLMDYLNLKKLNQDEDAELVYRIFSISNSA